MQTAGDRHDGKNRALKVVECDQTSVLATCIILLSEEVRRRFRKASPASSQKVRYNMETVLIVLLVLLLLGGGGWGCRRWRN